MMYDGILVGLTSFLVIGIFHPIVIRAEYHWSKKCWPLFLVVGLLLLICSILLDSFVLSAVVGVTGFSCLWSIKELFEQEKRVRRGWFPANPKRVRRDQDAD
ncbi:MAG: DUF4491 family protein [Ruminiclostridium sp.]|nr:DUF4491 family protein [Ruminiclostridium sp.]